MTALSHSHLAALAALALPATVFAQGGDLTPSTANGALNGAGLPQRSMKSLAEVEPRTLIDSLPTTILQPGSYYLGAHLTVNGNGITVEASDVTIDLNGFSIRRTTTGFGDVGIGISKESRLVVKNGSVVGFGIGISIDKADACKVENVRITTTGTHGLRISNDDGESFGHHVKSCQFVHNGGNGLEIACSGTKSLVDGTLISDCTFANSGNSAIWVTGTSGKVAGTRITGCTTVGSTYSAIHVSATGSVLNTVIDSCSVTEAGFYGIAFVPSASANYSGIRVTNCQVNEAIETGILVGRFSGQAAKGVLIESCSVSGVEGFSANFGFGIRLLNVEAGVVRNNLTCDIVLGNGNPGAGIHIGSGSNVVTGNTCIGANTATNFSFGPSVTHGPIVSATGTLGTTGAEAHPLANFSL